MRAIAVVSGKGGVGKTTTTINLGMSLNKLGKDVTIIDANILTPDIGLSLGAPVVPISLQHVLLGKKSAEKAIYIHDSGTKILPSSLSSKEDISLKGLKRVVSNLRQMSDIVLIDSPAGIGEDVAHSISSADECLIVTNPEMPALSSALKTIKLANQLGKKITGVLLTKHSGVNEVSLSNIETFLDQKIIGIIPEDAKIKAALKEKEPVTLSYPNSKSARGYMKLAKRISGYSTKVRSKGFFSNLLWDKWG